MKASPIPTRRPLATAGAHGKNGAHPPTRSTRSTLRAQRIRSDPERAMSERTVTRDDWLAAVPNLHRVGSEHHGPCPACGGEDRFRVTDTGAAFCRQCAPDGDGYKLLLHAAGLNGASKVRSLPIGAAERTEWRYHDRAGAPLVEVVKYVDAKDGKRKTALRHRPEWHPTLKPKKPAKADGWSWSRPGIGGGLAVPRSGVARRHGRGAGGGGGRGERLRPAAPPIRSARANRG